jgi:hypothetical protein
MKKSLLIWLEEEDKTRLKQKARTEKRSMSNLIVWLLEKYLNE